MTKIPFDIKYRPQIESGEYKVIYLDYTKEESPARIICWDRHNEYPIVALISNSGGYERVQMFQEEGIDNNNPPLGTLFIVTPEPEMSDWQTFISGCLQKYGLLDCGAADRIAKESSAELLALAREQFIKEGYVIEKKAFHDAVEKIDDKQKAEMSIEYSLHCKIEDGTRRAVMNWSEFQKVAQKFIDIGKNEALKDLPRWRNVEADKRYVGCVVRYMDVNGDWNYCISSGKLSDDCQYISIAALEKLPKEDESHE